MACNSTYFNISWLSDVRFSNWLQAVPSNNKEAKCRFCLKTFSLGRMGMYALTSHADGKKHKQLLKNITENTVASNSMLQFVSNQPSTSSAPSDSVVTSFPATPSGEPTVNLSSFVSPEPQKPFVINSKVVEGEIMWCLHSVVYCNSLRSLESAVKISKHVYDDSSIAQGIKLGKSKAQYLTVYGIAPYFQKLLLEELGNSRFVVVAFDESLNKVSQKGQMDIHVRFWRENKVESRYLTSKFLGHATATNLRQAIEEAITCIPTEKILQVSIHRAVRIRLRFYLSLVLFVFYLSTNFAFFIHIHKNTLSFIFTQKVSNIHLQISMDGPNVNLATLRSMKEARPDDVPNLIDIGSCSLHIVDGALRSADKVGACVMKFLSAIYYVFKDIPSRRADYIHFADCETPPFPLKFCQTRWVENVAAAERAITILPYLKSYVAGVSSLSQFTQPSSATYLTMKSALQDKLLKARLLFFVSIAKDLEVFLRVYQTDKPMLPFLHASLEGILDELLSRFIKQRVLQANPTVPQKLKLDLNDREILLPDKDVLIGWVMLYILFCVLLLSFRSFF